MKKSIGIITAAVIFICVCSAAQACLTGEGEYIVVFQPGISWEKAAAEVSGWGSSYHLATITTDGEQKGLEKLLSGLRGEFWIGGYQDSVNLWRWDTGEPWGYTHWAKGDPDGDSGPYWRQHLAIWGRNHGRSWVWNDEGNYRRISGYIVEREIHRHDQPPVVPIPPAIWLFASGVGILAGVRLVWKRRTRIPIGMADPQPK